MSEQKGPEQAGEGATPLPESSRDFASDRSKKSIVDTPPHGVEPATLVDAAHTEAPTFVPTGSAPPSVASSEAATAIESFPVGGQGAAVSPAKPHSSWGAILLQPGTVLANRYQIIETLGEGGMGAVYKATDRELERTIALKVIRPELANNSEVLQRFKQELILARQITDRNIIRIFDLGEADGIRYITMEYLEGESLYHSLRQRGKLAVDEVVDIMEQVFSGLRAAHCEGVIHRDLKPGNIMRDKQGRVVVMDFGLARDMEGDGMTRTGTMLGTMEYMSPEQAQAMDLDARSDIFSMGLICYEMLSGKMPFHADSAVASLLRRTRERAAPISAISRDIPIALSNIVSKCLERDPALRYQSAQAVLDDLHAWQGKSGKTRISASSSGLLINRARELPWKKLAASALAFALIVGVTWYASRRGRVGVTTQHAPVSVLVADFRNQTSDTLFDGTLEPAFNLALEGASFITAYSRGDAHKTAAELKPGSQEMDESLARLVAQREGVSVVIGGAIARDKRGYRITANAVDTITGNTLASETTSVQNKDEVLQSIGTLAAGIRKKLGDATPESTQMLQTATYSSSSLEATHEYVLGQQLQNSGKWEEAITHYQRALQLDPNMARAYAATGAAKFNLGRMDEAEKNYQQAMSHIDRMSDREKYRTRAEYFLVKHEPKQAIQEYTKLVQQFPGDTSVHTNLSFAYFLLRNMPMALEEARKSMEYSGKSSLERNNLAIASMYAGDFAGAEKEARTVMQQDPTYLSPYSTMAAAQIGQGRLDEAKQTYEKQQAISPRGSSLAKLGLADLALFQGRADEAIPILQSGMADDVKNKDSGAAAAKSIALAQAHLLAGRRAAAVVAADNALSLDKEPSVLHAAGMVFANAGDLKKATAAAAQLNASIEPDPQLYGKLLQAEIALARKDARSAVPILKDAENLADSWWGHFLLGRTYLEAGAFPEADAEIETCIKRKGEASALYLDEAPTFHLFPPIYYYLGRVQEGLKSPAAADSYKTFLSLQEKGSGPLVADAQKRVTIH